MNAQKKYKQVELMPLPHGGKRTGAGRKKLDANLKKHESVMIRVDTRLVELINAMKEEIKNENLSEVELKKLIKIVKKRVPIDNVFNESLDEFKATDKKAYAVSKELWYLSINPHEADAKEKMMNLNAAQIKDLAKRNGVPGTGNKESVIDKILEKRRLIKEIEQLKDEDYQKLTKEKLKEMGIKAGIKISRFLKKELIIEAIKKHPENFKDFLTAEIVTMNWLKKAIIAHKNGAKMHERITKELKFKKFNEFLTENNLGEMRVEPMNNMATIEP
ncbi:MAG: hypothetical protein PHQ03_07655 [Methylococcales bacterium]|nr:hypothetical protein [Methylococcales bacterium]